MPLADNPGTPPPPTTLRSWRQEVTDADPDFLKKSIRYWVYDFSNGRRFDTPVDPYQGGAIGE